MKQQVVAGHAEILVRETPIDAFQGEPKISLGENTKDKRLKREQ